MLSILLMTALAVQYPSASKPATDTTSRARQPAAAARDTNRSAAVTRAAFHDAMRVLWEDHIVFTRNYIISASAGLPDTTQVAERLIRNQSDIGDAIKPYYGDAAAAQLTALLSSHIMAAAKVIAIAKAPSTQANSQYTMTTARTSDTTKMRSGDTTKAQSAMSDTTSLNAAVAAWRANADSIAAFLSAANPRNWSRSTLQSSLRSHLDMTLKEATAHLHRDWAGSIAAYDEVHQQILQLADVLSEGIMKQFPNRFSSKATTMSSLQ